ncbi:MAG: hypothetical protein CL609_24140 [Anaerolineaceae bacterium]|nr:hypothetical protein [Anaerolineaceae bacterium]
MQKNINANITDFLSMDEFISYSQELYHINEEAIELAKQNNLEIALQILHKLTLLNPNSYIGWFNKGLCFARMGNLQESWDCFNKTIQIDNSEPLAWYNKAVIECFLRLNGKRSFMKFFELDYLDEYQELISRSTNFLRELEVLFSPQQPEKRFGLPESDQRYGTDGTPSIVSFRTATEKQIFHRENYKEILANNKDENFFNQNFLNSLKEQFEVGPKLMGDMANFQRLIHLKKMEIYLTITECNLEDRLGRRLFKFKNYEYHQVLDMTEYEFEEKFHEIQTDVIEEMHKNMLTMNNQWRNFS